MESVFIEEKEFQEIINNVRMQAVQPEKTTYSSEKNLIAAVLASAIHDIVYPVSLERHFDPCDKKADRESLRESARAWMHSEDPIDIHFSFLWCCDVLGLDAGIVRAEVANREKERLH